MDNLALSLIISERLPDADLASFSQADWELLIREAQTQGVGPLVYWTLSKSGKFSSLPESARNSLRIMYSSTWMHNQMIFKELEVLAHLFNQAGIPVVVLKGACFALTIYPDIGLRPMSDVDARRLLPMKYREAFLDEYWDAWVRRVERSQGAMPVSR
jgi:hypothetical protein